MVLTWRELSLMYRSSSEDMDARETERSEEAPRRVVFSHTPKIQIRIRVSASSLFVTAIHDFDFHTPVCCTKSPFETLRIDSEEVRGQDAVLRATVPRGG